METNIELDDLQMMKQQVALLKKKIDEEKLEHSRLLQLHDLIHKQLRTVNQDRNWMICMMILGCASMFFLYGDNQLVGLPFVIVTCLFFVLAIGYVMIGIYKLQSESVLNKELVEQKRIFLNFKKRQNRWLYFSIPFLVVWIPWFLMEITGCRWIPILSDGQWVGPEFYFTNGAIVGYVLIGAITGLVFGGWVGISKYRKSQKELKEIVDQIEELESGE